MAKLKTYKTRIPGTSTVFTSNAFTQEGALKQVWREIRGRARWNYGVKSFAELKRRARVERV